MMARISQTAAGGQNRVAFLDMLAHSEIGAALLAKSDDGYDVLVGSTAAHPLLFKGYADHPNILNARLNSTAAGRYQLLHRYFTAYAKTLGLPDFSPVSQDLIALRQIKEQGALPFIDAGRLADAVAHCSNIWASLPGSPYGQHVNEFSDLRLAYLAAGGTAI
jgi:muramidase (phage lysozyme)